MTRPWGSVARVSNSALASGQPLLGLEAAVVVPGPVGHEPAVAPGADHRRHHHHRDHGQPGVAQRHPGPPLQPAGQPPGHHRGAVGGHQQREQVQEGEHAGVPQRAPRARPGSGRRTRTRPPRPARRTAAPAAPPWPRPPPARPGSAGDRAGSRWAAAGCSTRAGRQRKCAVYCTRRMNGSPQKAVRQNATPMTRARRRNEARAAASGRRSTSTAAPSTSTMVVRMWLSTTAETSRAAARQPLPSSQTRQSTARASGSSANEIEKGNSPAIVLAMLPPQMVNCSVGVTWYMNRNTVAAQAASSGAGSRRRSTRNAAQQVTGSRPAGRARSPA